MTKIEDITGRTAFEGMSKALSTNLGVHAWMAINEKLRSHIRGETSVMIYAAIEERENAHRRHDS